MSSSKCGIYSMGHKKSANAKISVRFLAPFLAVVQNGVFDV
jgi:hypothetical protein